ncbi:MLH3 [Symbiodinium natans]|uniref:MLH3 protein n=1 Tax=Symbiodinium natans TaxID=878477 RepID=A0A812JD70_9DINO|nr:MLH3 [Symbiodinium natans]
MLSAGSTGCVGSRCEKAEGQADAGAMLNSFTRFYQQELAKEDSEPLDVRTAGKLTCAVLQHDLLAAGWAVNLDCGKVLPQRLQTPAKRKKTAQSDQRWPEEATNDDGTRSSPETLADFFSCRKAVSPRRRSPVTPTKTAASQLPSQESPSTPTRGLGHVHGFRAPLHGIRLRALCLQSTPEDRAKDRKRKRKSKHGKALAQQKARQPEAPEKPSGKLRRSCATAPGMAPMVREAPAKTQPAENKEDAQQPPPTGECAPTAQPGRSRSRSKTRDERMHPKLCSVMFHAAACARRAPVPIDSSNSLPIKGEDAEPSFESFGTQKACNLRPRVKLRTPAEAPRVKRHAESVELRVLDLQRLRPIAQVEAKFIVAYREPDLDQGESSARLLIIDQHAAAERVDLERLQRQTLAEDSQDTINVVQVHGSGTWLTLAKEEARWLQRYKAHAERWGFRWRAQGGLNDGTLPDEVVVTHVPNILGTMLAPRDLKAVLASADATSVDGKPALPPVVLHILAFKACRGAIKFGDSLSQVQIQALLRDLSSCKFPFQCAHGRPTVYPLHMGSANHRWSRPTGPAPLQGALCQQTRGCSPSEKH